LVWTEEEKQAGKVDGGRGKALEITTLDSRRKRNLKLLGGFEGGG
jgi:hypothetical protein